MKCLRCNAEMKHYEINPIFNIKGSWSQQSPFYFEEQHSHNPHSIYICDNCGYAELSTKFCEKPDV